jgi:hypothetical protein
MRLEKIENEAQNFDVRKAGITPQTKFIESANARSCRLPTPTSKTSNKSIDKSFSDDCFRAAIRDNDIVNWTILKLGRALIASKDLCQSTCPSTRKFTADQLDLETRPRIAAKHTSVRLWHCSMIYAKVGALIDLPFRLRRTNE